MKTLYTLTACLLAGMSLQAQTYLTEKDFQDQMITSGGWSNSVVTSTPGSYMWETSDLGSTGNFYARVSGYNGTPGSCDDTELWMITPAVNLLTATNPVLNFRNAEHFDGEELELLVSTDYDGTSDPSTQGTWDDITTSATWDTDPSFFVWTSSGNVDLSAYNGNANVYVAFKYISISSDPNGCKTWEIDEVSIGEPAAASTQTISSIQTTTMGDSPYKDSLVVTYGIVTASNANGYAIQDGTGAFTGIWVEDATNAASVNRGDSVEVAGLVMENFNFTIIGNVTSFNVISSSNPEPAATTVTTANANMEEWEGTKVVVEATQCTLDNDGFGQWVLNDGSGNLLVDDEIFDYPAVTNNVYWVTGIGWYAFSEFKIQVRDANDVLDVTSVEDIEIEVGIFPNPVENVLNVNAPSTIENITIYAIDGKVIDQITVNAQNASINTSEYASGNYMIKVITAQGIGTSQFVK